MLLVCRVSCRMRREDLWFEVDGVRCAAWLYLPDAPAPYPGVVLAHGFAGIRRARLDAYAERFAAAGLAALVFDYRCFGDSEGEPRQLLDIRRQLADWRAAIRVFRARPEVDPTRVALWGSSFSGGHVLTLAAEDAGVAAVVSQAPFMDGRVNTRDTGTLLGLRLGLAALRDVGRALLGRHPYYVNAAGQPGSLAAMTTPDAEPGYRSLEPPGGPWRFDVAARIFLSLPFYRPGLAASRVRCPILFCLAEQDVVTPIAPALAAAARAPRAEVRRYSVGHFDVYLGDTFEQVVADQVEFLVRHLQPDCGA